MTQRSPGALLDVTDVSKRFSTDLRAGLRYGTRALISEVTARHRVERPRLRPTEFWALDSVSLRVEPGEAVGIIGPNGAGKTTLLRTLYGVTKPDWGKIRIEGRVGALIDVGTSFDHLASGREAVAAEAAVLGHTRPDEALIDRILEFADIGDFADAPVRTYSTGMRMRLGYAVATGLRPDLMLIDEILAVGDVAFQRKCIRYVQQYLAAGGGVVLVSHDMWTIRQICDRCVVLVDGKVAIEGDVNECTSYYLAIGTSAPADPEDAAHAPVVTEPDNGEPGSGVPTGGVPATHDGAAGVEVTRAPRGSRKRLDVVHQSAVVLKALELHGDDGPPRSREPAVVELTVASNEPLGRVTWWFTLSPLDAPVPIATWTLDHAGAIELGEGEQTLWCRIHRLPLVRGTYHLSAGLDRPDGSPIWSVGLTDRPVRVAIDGDLSHGQTMAQILSVVAVAKTKWHVNRLDRLGGADSAADTGSCREGSGA